MDKKKLLGIIIAIISVIVITVVIILFIRKYEKDFVSLQQPEQKLPQQPEVTASGKTPEIIRKEEVRDLPQAEDNQFATENGKFLQ